MRAELGTFVVNNHNPEPLISISIVDTFNLSTIVLISISTVDTFNLRTIALSTHFSYSSKVRLPCGINIE